MPSTTLTIDQIEISPFNVRTHRPDAEDTAVLEASILAEGLLNPIVVHPMAGSKCKWGAIAGGRRTRAIRALVARGALPADWLVKVDIREGLSTGELLGISTTENLVRRDLRDHEIWRAVARMRASTLDPQEIADLLGQELGKVRKWARLGELAKPVFDAFVAGEITQEVATAFAATADVELQAAVFERLRAERSLFGNVVRAALKVGDREEARLLTFVGEGVYRAAGGGYELDLFADVEPDRGRVTDPALLRRLTEEKLASVRDQVRATAQSPELRFVADPPKNEWNGPDYQLQVTPKRDGDRLVLPAPAKGKGPIVAHVAVDAGGEPVVTYWWESRRAKFGGEKEPTRNVGPVPPAPIADGAAIGGGGSDVAARRADAAIKEEAGLGQDTIQVFRSLRKQILRALLVDDARAGGDVAADYLVWAQLRMLVALPGAHAGASQAQVGMRSISTGFEAGVSSALQRITDALGEQPAARTIADAIGELQRQPFLTDPDLADAFLDFRFCEPALKRLAAAVVVGLALERSLNAPGYQLAVHGAVADEIVGAIGRSNPEALAARVRARWTPTEALLGSLPKSAQVAIAGEFVDEPTLAAWGKLKATDLTHRLHRVLTGASPSTRADKRTEAERWVHPLLRFDPPGEPDAGDDASTETLELAEAAE